MKEVKRKITFFEIVLLFSGLGVAIVGFLLIYKTYLTERSFSIAMLGAIFLWLILFVLLILAAIVEDVKEEVGWIVNEMKDVNHELLEETRLLREDLKRKKMN